MGLIRFYFHPIFIIFSFCMIYFDLWQTYLVYMLALMLHEISHLLVAKMTHHNLNNVVFMPYGVKIDARGEYIKPSHELAIALAGPLCNIFLTVITVCLWWFYPTLYSSTTTFVNVNLTLAIFNLLPILPLDGGRVIRSLFYKNSKGIKTFMNTLSIIVSVVFTIMFIYSLFTKVNATYLFIASFLLSSLITSGNEKYYRQAGKYNDVLLDPKYECTVIVPSDIEDIRLVSMLESDKYMIFKYMDKSGKIVKTSTQKDIINKLTK